MPQAATELFTSHPLAATVDIDHARQVLSDVYLPLDFPSASPTAAVDLHLNMVKVGRITAGYLRFGDAIRIRTSEATDFHVDMPLTGRATMRAGSQTPVHGSPRTGAIFMPGHPADLDCDEDFSQMAVMIPKAELEIELENLLGHSVTKPLVFSAGLDLTSGPGCAVLETLRFIDHVSTSAPDMLQHPIAAQRLEQVLMESLLLAQPHNHQESLAAPVAAAGPRPVAHAIELLRGSLEHAWTVSELAVAVSVSVRSLQEEFRRSTSSTPMGYLRQLRLERIHDELLDAEPGSATVSDVAARWGITHLGRFAASYQRRFGEKPSETIRRAAESAERPSRLAI
ncbi:AraC family transcriptional regulator [Naasia lichenicola]|uniref:AraC family transcriptional regulator n=1 Tax=Naasia lichenicola TaxID=2565933 RepID=UPI001E3D4512|nr:AraC family transcriptional regulator [Naasia lichenicola]